MSRRSRPTSAGIWLWDGPRTTSNYATLRSRRSRVATTGPAGFQRSTGRPKCTWQHSRCRVLLPRRWRKRSNAGPRLRRSPRTDCSAGRRLLRDVEVELDQHVVRVGHENLPPCAVRHLIDAKRHTFAGEMLLERLEAAAAKRDMIDYAGIRPLRLVRGRDVVEMQHRMPFAVEPSAGKNRTAAVARSLNRAHPRKSAPYLAGCGSRRCSGRAHRRSCSSHFSFWPPRLAESSINRRSWRATNFDGLEHRKILQQRNHPENDHDHANDLSGATVERQHIDQIEYQNDDKERDEYANEDVHACPLRLSL